ncbi:DUF6546 domain-containing protein [Microdochium nivale]|nr:DUF6546 domain-containing protein [Microdochium nivale]
MAAPITALPFELRHLILGLVTADSHGQPRGLAGLASVCAEWQTTIEGFTFAHVHVTPARLDDFARIVVGRRRASVQALSLHVALDAYPTRLNDDKELPHERRHTSATVVRPLERLFAILHDWPLPPVRHRTALTLSVDSPSDTARDDKWGHAAITNRARRSPLRLERVPMTLLPNFVVGSIRCQGRHIQPTSILAIGSRCLALDTLHVELNHDSSSDRDEKQRALFGGSLELYAPRVRHLHLRRPRASSGSSVAPRHQPWSVFYSGLRRFSQQCESLVFDDCVDALEFFAPFLRDTVASDQDIPHWANLRVLHARNSYMLRRPYLRVKNQTQALVAVHKLMLALGQAVKHMPILEKARLSLCIMSNLGLEWITLTYLYSAGSVALAVRGITPAKVATDAWATSVAISRSCMLDIAIDPTDVGMS